MPFQFANLDQRAVNNPHSLIREFISQLEQLLVNLVYNTVESFDFRPDLGEDMPLMQEALNDLRESRIFIRVAESLQDADFENTRLTGSGLKAKLGLLQSISDQMRKGLRKALTYILDMANALLGSIQSALGPAGIIVDAIAEVKDMIKAKIDLINGW